jgi:hypothetical protein
MPGIFGTFAPLSSDLNLILQIVILAVLSYGVLKAKAQKFMQHGYLMLGCSALNTLSVLLVMIPVFPRLIQGVSLTVFSSLVMIHALVGLFVLILSYYIIYVWRLGLPAPCFKNRKLMVLLSTGWVAETIGGIGIYYLLYV